MLMRREVVWKYRTSETEKTELHRVDEAARNEPEVDSAQVAGSDDGVDGCNC